MHIDWKPYLTGIAHITPGVRNGVRLVTVAGLHIHWVSVQVWWVIGWVRFTSVCPLRRLCKSISHSFGFGIQLQVSSQQTSNDNDHIDTLVNPGFSTLSPLSSESLPLSALWCPVLPAERLAWLSRALALVPHLTFLDVIRKVHKI